MVIQNKIIYGYIYLTTFKNKYFYVGQHIAKIFEPEKYIGSGKRLRKLTRRYLLKDFDNVLLEVAYSQEELDRLEKYWIAYYRVLVGYKFCLNINDGGMGEINSEKSRRRAIQTLLKKYGYLGAQMHTEKAKENSRKAHIEKYGSMTACLNTPEAQAKKTAVIIERYGSANGNMMSPEARKKAITHMYKTNQEVYGSPYGKLCSEENRQAVCNLLQKQFGYKIQVEFIDKTIKTFLSLKEAARETGVSDKSFKRWINGEQISAKTKKEFGILGVKFIGCETKTVILDGPKLSKLDSQSLKLYGVLYNEVTEEMRVDRQHQKQKEWYQEHKEHVKEYQRRRNKELINKVKKHNTKRALKFYNKNKQKLNNKRAEYLTIQRKKSQETFGFFEYLDVTNTKRKVTVPEIESKKINYEPKKEEWKKYFFAIEPYQPPMQKEKLPVRSSRQKSMEIFGVSNYTDINGKYREISAKERELEVLLFEPKREDLKCFYKPELFN